MVIDIKKSILFTLIILVGSSFIGCGGSGNINNDQNSSPNPATGNTWDTMEWNKGQWG